MIPEQRPFTLEATDVQTSARAGKLRTAHGEIATPIFMPVGTQGAVKAMDHQTLRALDVPIILANTYHMYLRPGTETLKAMGGIH
jgi:queuine tRNA-ribosyltransferase